jgi:hypothetical protein
MQISVNDRFIERVPHMNFELFLPALTSSVQIVYLKWWVLAHLLCFANYINMKKLGGSSLPVNEPSNPIGCISSS